MGAVRVGSWSRSRAGASWLVAQFPAPLDGCPPGTILPPPVDEAALPFPLSPLGRRGRPPGGAERAGKGAAHPIRAHPGPGPCPHPRAPAKPDPTPL
ncbi:hypothetical protein GCM10010329_71940 [Streptomyces spiroverticillatus]|nr:hypothetical protein GCM10010329_71940 [Streptomyces spiroverticillatus]